MRFAIAAAALAAACLAVPAQAAVRLYQYAISATVTGTQTVYNPNQIGCNGGGPNSLYCLSPGPYSEAFTDLFVPLVSEDGTGTFNYGGCVSLGCYSGTIIGGFNPDGTPNFSGVDFSFLYQSIPHYKYGTAPTFAARLISVDGVAPVPEPATWAMLMLGFGGIGAALRRRRHAHLKPA